MRLMWILISSSSTTSQIPRTNFWTTKKNAQPFWLRMKLFNSYYCYKRRFDPAGAYAIMALPAFHP